MSKSGQPIIDLCSDDEGVMASKPGVKSIRKKQVRLPRKIRRSVMPTSDSEIVVILSNSSEGEAVDIVVEKLAQLRVCEDDKISTKLVNIEVQTDISIPPKMSLEPKMFEMVRVVQEPPILKVTGGPSSSLKTTMFKVQKQVFGHVYEESIPWNPAPLPAGCPTFTSEGIGASIDSEDATTTLKLPEEATPKENLHAHFEVPAQNTRLKAKKMCLKTKK